MRFIQGDTLKEAADRFHADGSIGPTRPAVAGLRKLLRQFVNVCNTIDYAHSRGVIHRDLKPANVIIGKHGETLVIDWGLAKSVGRVELGVDSGERTLAPSSGSGFAETQPGNAMGTPAYMSPEQADGDLKRLGRVDVYSLGATLYYLLTGRAPVTGDLDDVLRAVRQGDFLPARRDPTIDPPLEAVCLKAMAHRPEDRYDSPKALSEDLERWMADEPVSAWREPMRTGPTVGESEPDKGDRGGGDDRGRGDRIVGRPGRADESQGRHHRIASPGDRGQRGPGRRQRRAEPFQGGRAGAVRTGGGSDRHIDTGVSEDFLLKQDQFKDVRDRLLKAASDFYARLGRLLGQESDRASRRGLWLANYEVAGLTARVGKPEDALVAHRQVLAAREALMAETRLTRTSPPTWVAA